MVRFYVVIDRDDGKEYAVMAMTDQVRAGYTDVYRWVPNFGTWVIDRGLKRDFRSFPGDQLNEFVEISLTRAEEMAREFPIFTTQWIIDSYEVEDERLTSTQLGLPLDASG